MSRNLLKGQCLCGAVKITVRDPAGWVGVCHCDMCKRWSGAVFSSFPAKDVTVAGAVETYQSSPTSTRSFCPKCGSHLYMQDAGEPNYDMMPGLFDATRDWPLTSEIYTDHALCWAHLAGPHKRATQNEYEAEYPSPMGDKP
ncbi:GFA family protein [Lentibacter algarum]|uniref:GFA family protein n=1 Tax=Lentibacter algarum TaxID=576131 RepID=UPI001C07482E|nr:GFA family protein [Lentibacter algarum]MBU2980313.1 GFA family protein [Lentibacter algarum]